VGRAAGRRDDRNGRTRDRVLARLVRRRRVVRHVRADAHELRAVTPLGLAGGLAEPSLGSTRYGPGDRPPRVARSPVAGVAARAGPGRPRSVADPHVADTVAVTVTVSVTVSVAHAVAAAVALADGSAVAVFVGLAQRLAPADRLAVADDHRAAVPRALALGLIGAKGANARR
jgi:hypothetical protein